MRSPCRHATANLQRRSWRIRPLVVDPPQFSGADYSVVLIRTTCVWLGITYRVLLSCSGVPLHAADEAARDIAREFAEHRTWHSNASCTWDGSKLLLSAENDYDETGLALLDEFSDCISAYLTGTFDFEVQIESVVNRDA